MEFTWLPELRLYAKTPDYCKFHCKIPSLLEPTFQLSFGAGINLKPSLHQVSKRGLQLFDYMEASKATFHIVFGAWAEVGAS